MITMYRIRLCLGILIFIAGLLSWRVYMYPFQRLGILDFWHSSVIVGNLLMLSFLAAPALGLLGVWQNWKSKYLWLALAPIIFSIYGYIPIPLSSYLYSDDPQLNKKFIIATNLAIIGLVVWLYIMEKKHTNKKRNGMDGSVEPPIR